MFITNSITISICRFFTNTKMHISLLNTEISVINITHIQIFILFISISIYTTTKHQILSALTFIIIPHSNICHQHQYSIAGYLCSKQFNLIATKLSSNSFSIKLLLSISTFLRSNSTRLSPEETLQKYITPAYLFFAYTFHINIVLSLREHHW